MYPTCAVPADQKQVLDPLELESGGCKSVWLLGAEACPVLSTTEVSVRSIFLGFEMGLPGLPWRFGWATDLSPGDPPVPTQQLFMWCWGLNPGP